MQLVGRFRGSKTHFCSPNNVGEQRQRQKDRHSLLLAAINTRQELRVRQEAGTCNFELYYKQMSQLRCIFYIKTHFYAFPRGSSSGVSSPDRHFANDRGFIAAAINFSSIAEVLKINKTSNQPTKKKVLI